MGIGGWRFYTFNVADSAISIAIVLLLAAAIFGRCSLRTRPVAEMVGRVRGRGARSAAGTRADRFVADAAGLSRARTSSGSSPRAG